MSNFDLQYILLKRREGGKMLVPVDEIGLISDLLVNRGTEEQPDWQVDYTGSLIHIKCVNLNIIIDQSVEDIALMVANHQRKVKK